MGWSTLLPLRCPNIFLKDGLKFLYRLVELAVPFTAWGQHNSSAYRPFTLKCMTGGGPHPCVTAVPNMPHSYSTTSGATVKHQLILSLLATPSYVGSASWRDPLAVNKGSGPDTPFRCGMVVWNVQETRVAAQCESGPADLIMFKPYIPLFGP
uniref:Uncharacterized protein n=1 Tax=Knipowitschia caucasica TaxID=637954 RepID=A0AAV2M719_KNICA